MYNIQKTELMNNSTQPETIQVQKHLFREVEKRYNITIDDEVIIGKHHELCEFGIIDYTIEEVFNDEESYEKVNIGNIPLMVYNDIYKLTGSGYFSYSNIHNILPLKENTQIFLIPIITISRGSRGISFWMDDDFLRSLFYDTELIMYGDKYSPDSTPEEIEEELKEELKKEYNKQLNRLNKLFKK